MGCVLKRAARRAAHERIAVNALLGPLTLVTAPTAWPLSVAQAQAQCRVEGAEAELTAAEFLDAIKEATDYCEQNIPGGRQLMTATWDLPVAGWWDCPLKLPLPPLQSVTSVKYYDSDGDLTTVSSSLYVVRAPHRAPGEIELLPNQTWPTDYDARQYPIVVRFVAGYTSAANVPGSVKRALKLLVAHWNENREATLSGSLNKEIEFSVSALLESAGWGCYA